MRRLALYEKSRPFAILMLLAVLPLLVPRVKAQDPKLNPREIPSGIKTHPVPPLQPGKLVLTYSSAQWTNNPPAVRKMAQVFHDEGMPVNWILSLENAKALKPELDRWHKEFGDELVVIRQGESMADWRTVFPWARLNIAAGARPGAPTYTQLQNDGTQAIWGYCDMQVGNDGITHWGCPWGLFPVSPKTTFTPPTGDTSTSIIGIPWCLRDLHKDYHLGQAITGCFDTIEHIRAQTMCWGKDVTFFQDTLDELVHNLPWNERIYLCLHDEPQEAYVAPGQKQNADGITPVKSEAMYEMMRQFIRYAKSRGAAVMTLPQAVDDYKKTAGKTVLSSTLLTTDKFHGRVVHYNPPFPDGIKAWDFGPAGLFPDTLFHFDQDCQLVFVHPEMVPRTILNYMPEPEVLNNAPYPTVQPRPTLLDWKTRREGDMRTYFYRVQSYYETPFGLAEWGDFREWEVVETNALWARIIDDRVLVVRMNLEKKGKDPHTINLEAQQGYPFIVKLKRKPHAN